MYPLSEVATRRVDDGPELTIVHIPNLSQDRGRTQSDPIAAWTKLLPMLTSCNARVLRYHHNLIIEEPFEWSDLFSSGYNLLNRLFEEYHPKEARLGGLIVKQALVTAGDQAKRYRGLLDSVLGLIFIGVPHVKDVNEDTVTRVTNLLRPALRSVSKKSLRKEELHKLGLLSEKFREVRLPLPEGLISGYETEHTQLASVPWKVGKPFAILVDKRFAAIDWPSGLEKLLPLDVQLDAVLQPDRPCEFRKQLKGYIVKVATAGFGMISEERASHKPVPCSIPPRQASFPPAPISSPEHDSSPPQPSPPEAGLPFRSFSHEWATVSGSSMNSPQRVGFASEKTPSLGTSNSSGLSSSRESDSSFEIVTSAASFSHDRRRINLPCYMLKPHTKNKRFWPREDILSRIESALLPTPASVANTNGSQDDQEDEPNTLRTYVLHGIGGVGKTELAIEFVFRHKDKFDAVFILHGDTSSRLSSEYIQMADKLGLNYDGDAENAKGAVKNWLANPGKVIDISRNEGHHTESDSAKWLIVYDNVDRPEILREFWEEDAKGSILVTSRDPEANDLDYYGDLGEEVKPLTNDDGAAFLRSLTRSGESEGSTSASQELAFRLDGLPLAIEQISAFIRKHRLKLSEFLNAYKNDKDFEALQDKRIAPKRGYEYSIAGVWALQDLSKGSLALLNIMSFLDPDCMQRDLFRRTLPKKTKNSYPTSELQYIADLTGLLERSLVSQSLEGDDLRVHRLVQDVSRAGMRAMGILQSHFDEVVSIIWSDYPRITRGGVGRAHKIDRWERCEELFPHIVRLRDFFVTCDDREGISCQTKFADLLNEAGWYQFERTNPALATPLLDLAYDLCEKSDEDCTEQLALILGSKTWIAVLTKDFEAAHRHAQQRVECEEKLFAQRGMVTANLAAAYNDLGAAYSMNRLPSKAFPLLDKSKALRESMPEFKKEHNFSPLLDLGRAHQLQGHYDKAVECLLQALVEREAALGKNDRQSVRTGQLFYALGNVRAAQGQFDESFMWHQKALLHYRATAGDNHHKTGVACFRVAEHHVRYRQYELARLLLDQALKVFQNRAYYQEEHARTCFLYARVLADQGKSLEAREILERSVAAFNAAFPNTPRTTADLTADDFNALCTYDF
ncbi:hypothetical protein DV736_g1663, partial [Chaetothyriales sp. CBS 134916]